MKREKVVLNPYPRPVEMILSPEDLVRLHDMADVVWGQDDPMPIEAFDEVRDEVFAIITMQWPFGSVETMPKLRAVLEVGGRHLSPDVLDYKRCFERGIRLLSCAPAFGPMVAEMALGMAIASAREIVDAHNDFASGEERYLFASNQTTFTLFGHTVGLIGFGGLARSLLPLLAPFDCEIQVYDPWLPDTYIRQQGGTPVGLETLLETSEVIFVLAIPSNENQAMLDRALLSRISPGAVFVLISRSHVVDFDALTELLHEGRFKAAIDVFPEEPLPLDHPIRSAPNTILSAHRAGSVTKDLQLIGHMAVNDLEAMLAGLPPTEMQVAQPEIVYRLP